MINFVYCFNKISNILIFYLITINIIKKSEAQNKTKQNKNYQKY